jgi:hypothetical protein
MCICCYRGCGRTILLNGDERNKVSLVSQGEVFGISFPLTVARRERTVGWDPETKKNAALNVRRQRS